MARRTSPTQRLLQKAAADYVREIKTVRARMVKESIGAGETLAAQGLKTMHGACVIGIYTGDGQSSSIVVQRDGVAALAKALLQIAAA